MVVELFLVLGLFSQSAQAATAEDWASCVLDEVKRVLAPTRYSELRLASKVFWHGLNPYWVTVSAHDTQDEQYTISARIESSESLEFDVTTKTTGKKKHHCWISSPSSQPLNGYVFRLNNNKDYSNYRFHNDLIRISGTRRDEEKPVRFQP